MSFIMQEEQREDMGPAGVNIHAALNRQRFYWIKPQTSNTLLRLPLFIAVTFGSKYFTRCANLFRASDLR